MNSRMQRVVLLGAVVRVRRRHDRLVAAAPASTTRVFAPAARDLAAQRDRSCAARRPGSASRADCRARPRAATARRPRAAPPAPRPRRRRSRRSAGRRRRAPAARARAAGARPGRIARRRVTRPTGGALITWRTSIGMFSGAPPGPGRRRRPRGDLVGALRCSRRRRSSSRRGTPWPRRTARR